MATPNIFEVLAGRMVRRSGGILEKDPRKGLLFLYDSSDRNRHLCWKSLEVEEIIEHDTTIVPEVIFCQSVLQMITDKVLMFGSTLSQKRIYFYVQDSETDIKATVDKINELLKDSSLFKDTGYEVPGQVSSWNIAPDTTAVEVEWRTPFYQGINPVTGFVLRYGEGKRYMHRVNLSATENCFTLTELTPDTQYVIGLCARNENGDGEEVSQTTHTLKIKEKSSIKKSEKKSKNVKLCDGIPPQFSLLHMTTDERLKLNQSIALAKTATGDRNLNAEVDSLREIQHQVDTLTDEQVTDLIQQLSTSSQHRNSGITQVTTSVERTSNLEQLKIHMAQWMAESSQSVDAEAYLPILMNVDVQKILLALLPSGYEFPKTVDEFRNTLLSDKFQQIEQVFNVALTSRTLTSLMVKVGLDDDAVRAACLGDVKAFNFALQKSAKKPHQSQKE